MQQIRDYLKRGYAVLLTNNLPPLAVFDRPSSNKIDGLFALAMTLGGMSVEDDILQARPTPHDRPAVGV